MCFGSFCHRIHAWLDEMDGSIAITQWARWIESPVLVCGYFGMYTEGGWMGFSSVGPFVWATHVFWSFLRMDALQFETASYIAIPHEQDGLDAPSLFASISACIQKRP